MSDNLVKVDEALMVHSQAPLQTSQVLALCGRVQGILKEVMKEGVHYGTVPGCGDKLSLLKPGAEKLSMTFRLLPRFDIQMRDLGSSHREYSVICTLEGPDGGFRGQGVGLCSTMETKYHYRQKERCCPCCGKSTIIKGKEQYGGGWICFAKKGGCGAKFADGDASIEKQVAGRAENPDIADTYNTVLKMAKKRAHVDAIITATAASDIFTQDIEDDPEAFASSAAMVSNQPDKNVKPETTRAEVVVEKPERDYHPETTPPDPEPACTKQQRNAIYKILEKGAKEGFGFNLNYVRAYAYEVTHSKRAASELIDEMSKGDYDKFVLFAENMAASQMEDVLDSRPIIKSNPTKEDPLA